MPALIVPCPHCKKPSRLESDSLPDQPAYYPCPHCKQKVVVDKRKLMAEQAEQAAQAAPAPSAASATPPAPAAPAAPAKTASNEETNTREAVELPSSSPSDRRFGRIPADSRFPSGIIVGDDPATIEEIRAKLATVGSELEVVESAEEARQLILNEGADLCIFASAGEVSAPHEPMMPLTGLPPSVRRGMYLALVADNLKTLDGTSAFMFQVNMVFGKQDMAQFETALYSGIDYHARLYRPYFQAVEKKNSF